jgi:hypothetical protein
MLKANREMAFARFHRRRPVLTERPFQNFVAAFIERLHLTIDGIEQLMANVNI